MKLPEEIDETKVRAALLNDFTIEIGAGLGYLSGKVWKIVLMGYSSNDENIGDCVKAFKNILDK